MLETHTLIDEAKLITIWRTLPPAAAEQLFDFALFLQSRLSLPEKYRPVEQDSDLREEEFIQELIREGLMQEIKKPVTDLRPYQNRTLIEIEGKPLSQIIIEERR